MVKLVKTNWTETGKFYHVYLYKLYKIHDISIKWLETKIKGNAMNGWRLWKAEKGEI